MALKHFFVFLFLFVVRLVTKSREKKTKTQINNVSFGSFYKCCTLFRLRCLNIFSLFSSVANASQNQNILSESSDAPLVEIYVLGWSISCVVRGDSAASSDVCCCSAHRKYDYNTQTALLIFNKVAPRFNQPKKHFLPRAPQPSASTQKIECRGGNGNSDGRQHQIDKTTADAGTLIDRG